MFLYDFWFTNNDVFAKLDGWRGKKRDRTVKYSPTSWVSTKLPKRRVTNLACISHIYPKLANTLGAAGRVALWWDGDAPKLDGSTERSLKLRGRPHKHPLSFFFLSFFFFLGVQQRQQQTKKYTQTHTHTYKEHCSPFFFRKMKWVNYQSNMYKYGLLFMCAAAVLALMNDGGGSKASWEWMNQQRELREQEKKRIQWRSHCQNRTEQSTCRVHSWSMNLPQCPSRSCNNPVDKKKERKKEAILTVWLLVRESSGSCSLQVLLLNTFFFLLAFSFFFF